MNEKSLWKWKKSSFTLFTTEQRICLDRPAPNPKGPPWMTNPATVNEKSSIGQPEIQHRATETIASGSQGQRTQVKISVMPELASAFKSACTASNVSMAEALSGFMAKYTNTVIKRKPEYTTRRQRRTAVRSITQQLEQIKAEEERYRDAIPENLQGSVVYETADQSVSFLDEAIELLISIY